MKSKMLPRLALIFASISTVFSVGNALAGERMNKVDFTGGYYAISATTGSKSGSLSNIGIYQINVRRRVFENVEIGLGYSFAFESIFTGDSAYGLDLMAYYFPFTRPMLKEVDEEDVQFQIIERWRPFIGGGFAQRTFKSVQTDYAGIGITAGAEYALDFKKSFIGKFRYLQMGGPSTATATAMDIQFGLSFSF